MFARRIWLIANFFVILLLVLSTRIVYWQLVRGEQLSPVGVNPVAAAVEDNQDTPQNAEEALDELLGAEAGQNNPFESLPQPLVQRTISLLSTITRGSIYDRNGRLLAYDTLDENGNLYRFYTEPSMANVIGYVSGIRMGVAGIEQSYNETLLGVDRPDSQLNQLIHNPIVGSDLVVTLDTALQRRAMELLQGRAGSIIVMDGHSGAVLAMASSPSFDPNQVLNQDYINNLLQSCGGAPTCRAPFLNRPAQSRYTPGSTYKTVTLTAGLDSGYLKPDMVIDFGQPVNGPNGPYYVYNVDGGTIPDFNHKESKLTLPQSFAKSANAAFARFGDEMGAKTFIEYSQRLGFSRPEDEAFQFDIPYTPSQLANNVDDLRTNNLLRASTAIGQGELLATPLNMGMVVLPVLNEGRMPLPYLVESIREPSGRTTDGPHQGDTLRGIMKAATAKQVHDMMITVVQTNVTGAAVPGAVTGGKTGTAQLGGSAEPHSWLIGFVEKGDQAYVIVVMIENGGSGARISAPTFAQIGAAALNMVGQPVQEVIPNIPPAVLPTPAVGQP